MSGLHIRVLLPTEVDAGAYQVSVALRDTSMEDAEHPTVAEVRTELQAGTVTEVYLPVPVDPLDPRNRYTLWVHASSGDTGRLAPGDYITTAAVPVGVSDIEQERRVDVALQRI